MPGNLHIIASTFIFSRNGWHVSFLEPDFKTSLPLKLIFATPDKLLELFERWGESRLLEDRSALEYAIQMGRGSIWLILSAEQYGKPKR
jgi:hypothetical protein